VSDRTHVQNLKARIDTENIPSMKNIAKLGARKGETLLKAYSLGSLGENQGPDGIVPEEKRRDFICWYLDRPQA
jgi:hypothetical protein